MPLSSQYGSTVSQHLVILYKSLWMAVMSSVVKQFPLPFVFIDSSFHFVYALIEAFVDGSMQSQTYLTFSTKPVSPLALRNAGWVTAAWIWANKECDHCSDHQNVFFCPAPPPHAPQTAVVWRLKAMPHARLLLHSHTHTGFIHPDSTGGDFWKWSGQWSF